MPPKTKIFLELRPEVKVTMIQKQCVLLRNPKMYSRNKFWIPTSNYIRGMVRTRFFLNGGQGHSDPKTVHETPGSQGVSNNIGDTLWTRFSSIEVRDQGHINLKIVCDTRCIYTPNLGFLPQIIYEMTQVFYNSGQSMPHSKTPRCIHTPDMGSLPQTI